MGKWVDVSVANWVNYLGRILVIHENLGDDIVKIRRTETEVYTNGMADW